MAIALKHETGRSRSDHGNWWAAGLAMVAVLAAVVAVDPMGSRPYTTLRWPLVAATLLAAGALVWRRKAMLPRSIVALGLGFLVWMTLSALAADDGVVPWLGHPRRHFGLLAWVVCAVAFVVGASLRQAGRRALGVAACVGSGLLGAGALLELAGFSVGGAAFPGGRTGGLSGQPAYLGALGVLLVPVAVGIAAGTSSRWRWGAWCCVALGVAGVTASQTRGALLALSVAAVLGLTRLGRRSWVPLLAAGLVFVYALAIASPIGGRLMASFEADHSQVQGRLDEWRVAGSALRDHPLLGVGPEGYRLVATEYIDDAYSARYGRDVVVDRAHDGVIDVTVTGGIPAGALYVALRVAVGVRMWRARRARSTLVAGAAIAVLAYGVQQLVLFPLAEVDPLMWLLAGLAVVGDGPQRRPIASGMARSRSVAATSWGLGALAVAVLMAGGLDVASDREMARAQEKLAAGRHVGALSSADRATELRPDSVDAWYLAARVAHAGGSLIDVDVALERTSSGLRNAPRDPALLDLQEQMLVERAVRSGLAIDLDLARTAVALRRGRDPANPLHPALVAQLDAVATGSPGQRS